MTTTATQKILHVVEPLATGVLHSIGKLCWALNPAFQFHILHGIRPETPQNYRTYFPETTTFTNWCAGREINILQDWQALRELRKTIKKINPDVVHAHSSKAGALVRLAAPKHLPVIYSPRGYSFLRRDLSLFKRKFYYKIEQMLGRRSHITVACGLGEYEESRKVSRRAVLIRNMVDLADFEAYNLPKPSLSPMTVAMVGGIRPQKNFPLFCRIAANVQQHDIKFLWIGGGEAPFGVVVPDNVSITGWLPRDRVLSTLANCHVFMQTSLWEGLPISVLEAMAVGLPILAKPATGNTELVIEGVNGHICDSAEEFSLRLEQLANNVDTFDLYGRQSRKIIEENFSSTNVIRQWKSLYENYNRYYQFG